MKIKPEHLTELKDKINTLLTELNANGELVEKYETGNFYKSETVKDLQKRFCFDLTYIDSSINHWICDTLYSYMDDTHLYTALKSISPIVIKRY